MISTRIPKNVEFDSHWNPTNYVSEKDKKIYARASVGVLMIILLEYIVFFFKIFSDFYRIGFNNFLALAFILLPIFIYSAAKLFNREGSKLRADKIFFLSCCQLTIVTFTFAIYLGPLARLNRNTWQNLLRFALCVLICPVIIGLVNEGIFMYFRRKQILEDKPRDIPKWSIN